MPSSLSSRTSDIASRKRHNMLRTRGGKGARNNIKGGNYDQRVGGKETKLHDVTRSRGLGSLQNCL